MKLGTKLIVSLVIVVIVTMTIHGYLSIQQERESVERELRVGMRGFARVLQATLRHLYAERRDLTGTQEFIDIAGPKGNIHGVIVYDRGARPVVRSASLRYATDFPDLDLSPIMQLDPAPVLRDGKTVEDYLRGRGVLISYRIEPILDSDNRIVGALVLARQGYRLLAGIEQRRSRIIYTTSALVILLSLLILFLVRRGITRPIHELIGRIREIGKGRWEQRIEISGRDEVAALAREFNSMREKLQESYSRLLVEQREKLKLERELRHTERLASVGRLAAGLAHEIGTPLNIIGGRAEYLLRRARTHEELQENLAIMRSQIDRITAIVRQLLEFSRRREPVFRAVDLPALLRNVQRLLEHQIREKSIRVEMEMVDDLPPIKADSDLLQQVFINLYSNSIHAVSRGGLIKIRAAIAGHDQLKPNQTNGACQLRIWFEDNGAGIAPEHLEQVFDPFFTTKDVGEGSGLGLSVAYGIIQDHKGEIKVESEPARYARFIINLPLEMPSSTSEQDRKAL